jgi:PqqD family protein of HPr-rel-A system
MAWRLNTPRVTSWRNWDGEVVVYDDLSGDTMKLDIVMSAIFRRMQQGTATTDDLVRHLAKVLDLEMDLRLQRLVEIALERFEDSGLLVVDLPAMPATTKR